MIRKKALDSQHEQSDSIDMQRKDALISELPQQNYRQFLKKNSSILIRKRGKKEEEDEKRKLKARKSIATCYISKTKDHLSNKRHRTNRKTRKKKLRV